MQYHERLCVKASHTHCFWYWGNHWVLIVNFFSKITNPGHCLHHLLPPNTSAHCPYSLRKRQHYHQLSNIEFSQHKNCFINRCLFKYRWLYFVLYYFVTFYVFLFIFILSLRNSMRLKRLLDLTWRGFRRWTKNTKVTYYQKVQRARSRYWPHSCSSDVSSQSMWPSQTCA